MGGGSHVAAAALLICAPVSLVVAGDADDADSD